MFLFDTDIMVTPDCLYFDSEIILQSYEQQSTDKNKATC